MKAEDTVMERYAVEALERGMPVRSTRANVGLRVAKAQAGITLKAVTDELKKQVEGVKANAFSVSLFGGREHQLEMTAMVSAYDVVLNKIKEMGNERIKK